MERKISSITIEWQSIVTCPDCGHQKEEQKPALAGIVKFDPEADMFCAYSLNKEALKEFALSFKEACENDILIKDLFSRAEPD
ncbi:Immunity protein 51 [Chitinophaga eiseniae]|uniref:Immunity protein 51 n=1 Tax=Chitinophaga eiseniae TaxID=634771 RepID=A0A1T4TV11_9BACT|nr:Imm51 family immunity protein [Chitinophaga eiseniae]SKA44293.1 Immunity protein 51 [Chitinophaga eiseniae]